MLNASHLRGCLTLRTWGDAAAGLGVPAACGAGVGSVCCREEEPEGVEEEAGGE